MPLVAGDFKMDGVASPASPVECTFLRPGYTNHSLVLATGHPVDILLLPNGYTIESSLVMAGNPTVFI